MPVEILIVVFPDQLSEPSIPYKTLPLGCPKDSCSFMLSFSFGLEINLF